jgi:type VI secretion system protein ImpF
MAKSDSSRTVTQSLLDRLIDDKPREADAPMSRAQSVRNLKESLKHDLEWLLNTRRNPDAAPDSMQELSQSLFNYGLPDFSALSVSSTRDRDRLLVELERTVALFEPRLKDIRITLTTDSLGYSRVLHFQIEGMLQMDPAPEQVSFDTVLQLASGEYKVRGERGA